MHIPQHLWATLAAGIASELRNAANDIGYIRDPDTGAGLAKLPALLANFRNAYELACMPEVLSHPDIKHAKMHARPQIEALFEALFG